jgi:hypothetical protein
MATAAGTLESLALEMGKALQPLEDLLTPEIFPRLGLSLPAAIAANAGITAKLSAAAAKAGELEPKIQALATAITGDNPASIISAGVPLIATIAELIAKLKELGDAVHTAAAVLPPLERTPLQDLAAQMAVRVLEYVTVGYLNEKMPGLTSTLTLLGIIDKETKANVAVPEQLPAIVPRRFHLDRLPKLLSSPDQYLQQQFQWGSNGFNGLALLQKIGALLQQLGVPIDIYTVGGQPPILEAYLFSLQADKGVNPPGLNLELNLPGNTDFDKQIPFSDLWKGTVHVHAAFAAGVTAKLRPPFELHMKPPSGNIDLDVLLGIKAEKTANDPLVLLGATGGTRLQAKSIGGSVGLSIQAGTAGAAVDPLVQISIEEGKLIVDFSEGDGFIQRLLSGIHLEAGFSLTATWDPKSGLRLQGSGGVEVFLPLHLDLSVIVVNGLYFSIAISNETPLKLGLATQIQANLGPLKAVVDHLGVNIPITFPANGAGRLGMADIGFEFAPPKGVGLSIDAGPVKGGGFLYLDYDKGEYYGVLELSFQNMIDLKAVGIINTKMPDGSTGFALLILITAEFTPIQLGFGFTLNGVGGLLALNRSTDITALQTGVKTGAVSSILFPEDVVANVTRIISDLKAIFPIVEGHFVIAPMAKLGWGTPTLISLELGIIIDIPAPQLVILGILKCVLPTEEAAILKLQVNFAGGIDFDRGLIWFNASLFDSRLLTFTLAGDMALRIGWKGGGVFIITVGGFHPAYQDVPPDLSGMTRLTISLLSGNNPRITVQTYFAITSNSVQSGARAELYAEACGFNVYGYLGYDLLVQFNPFYFIADIYAGLALRHGSSELAGIHVHCQLSGPTPWHALGEASLKILFFTVSVSFDVTWGEDAPAQPVETEDILPLVVAALNDSRNWKAELPANTVTHVSLKKLELPEEEIIIHPVMILSVSQKIVPLEIEINKFGNKQPATDKIFHLTNEDAGTSFLKEEFAVGNFIKLNDNEKLSRKSFESMKSGLQFQTSNTVTHGSETAKEVNYELSYIHRKKRRVLRAGLIRFLSAAFNVLVQGGAISKNANSVGRKIANNAPAKVDVTTSQYMVVNVSDMQLHAEGMTAGSEAEAYYMQEDLIRKNPSLKNKIQVVSQFEMN